MAGNERFLEVRRETLRAQPRPKVNGIDFVEVNMGQLTIDVHFVRDIPGTKHGIPSSRARLNKNDFTILGGDRIRNVKVLSAKSVNAQIIRLKVDQLGDFSAYELVIDDARMDPLLSRITFGFRTTCPSDFDCKTDVPDQAVPAPDPALNYLAKDYDSFRQAMLDRMAQLSPEHADRQIPDIGTTLVELLSYYADHLSYAQDAASTEAYLSTARRRSSLRRHAQLLGYDVHDGISARAFVQVLMSGSGTVRRDQISFMTRNEETEAGALSRSDVDVPKALAAGVKFFEPLQVLHPDTPEDPRSEWTEQRFDLDEAHNRMELHDWGDPRAVLPKGATYAWIRDPSATFPLKAGDFVSLELVRDPVTRRVADAEISMRQVVCLKSDPIPQTDTLSGTPVPLLRLDWLAEDALAFDLPVGTLGDLSGLDDGPAQMALAYGNIIPSDHGVMLPNAEILPAPEALDDPEARDEITALSALDRPRRYQPVLRYRDITVGREMRKTPGLSSVSALVHPSLQAGGHKAIWLSESESGLATWEAVNTLLYSRDDDPVFVPETEQDGQTRLRFGGQDQGGMRPEADVPLYASYRVGVGRAGNIGAGSIAHVLLDGVSGPVGARNPLPAFGGRDRESLPEICSNALAQLDDNRRAVTRADYERLAAEHPDVSRALVRSIWHGSWENYVVAVDPVNDIVADQTLLDSVRDYLEPLRLMGQDLIVEAPNFAPLEIEVRLCICSDFLASDVRKAVLERLSSGVLADGTLGFFHPDNLSFGTPIYHSQLVSAIKSVAGVSDVGFSKFRRWRSTDTTALEAGVIEFDPDEIPILMNDPSFPERGVLRVIEWSVA